MLGKLMDGLFEGSARRLVAHLLEQKRLNAKDREAIRRMLDEGKGAKPKGGDR